jgi:hypothetical protein
MNVLAAGFLPGAEKLTEMSRRVRAWRIHRRTGHTLDGLAEEINPVLGGWLGYFTAFYQTTAVVLFVVER